jgi:hypothetical protein
LVARRLDSPGHRRDAAGSPWTPSEREAGGAPVRVLSTILVLLAVGVLLAYTLRRRT